MPNIIPNSQEKMLEITKREKIIIAGIIIHND